MEHDEHGGPVLDDGAEGGPSGAPPADRWRTVRSTLSSADVRRRLAQFLTSGSHAVALTETRAGFLARVPRRPRPFVVEITLAEWDGGTQVQVTAPQEAGATARQLDDLERRIAAAIG